MLYAIYNYIAEFLQGSLLVLLSQLNQRIESNDTGRPRDILTPNSYITIIVFFHIIPPCLRIKMPTLASLETTVALAKILETTLALAKISEVVIAHTANGAIIPEPFPPFCRVDRVSGVQCFLVLYKPSSGPSYVQPSFVVGSDKYTYPFVVLAVESLEAERRINGKELQPSSMPYILRTASGPFRSSSFLSIPSKEHILGLSLSRNLYYSLFISIVMQPSSLNGLLLLSKLSSTNAKTSYLGACPYYSNFHKSTATRAFPFFAESCGDISLYDFDSTVVLPFRPVSSGNKTARATSGYSCISKIWIHPAHQNFHDTVQKNQKNIFALKKLRSDRIEDFKREARALHGFAVHPHDHIVRLLTAFRHDGSFYLLFPWAAGGNLRSFWREHPQLVLDSEVLVWVAEQFLGITTALHEIHHQGYQGVLAEVRAYHGDIKPENILLFEGDRQGGIRHVWKIGDFGVSRRFLVAARGGDVPKGFTPTYQSPEHRIEGRIDDRADIWSLGCVFLETVIWLLWGWKGLVSFRLMRERPTRSYGQHYSNIDGFVDVVHTIPDNASVPVLKPAVIQCIESLCCDSNISPYLKDLLHLIRRYLLDVNKHTRLSSDHLVKALRQLHRRCVDEPAYTVAVPRPQKPPLPITIVHCESHNRCIADLSTSGNPFTSKTPQSISFHIANPRNITQLLRAYKHQQMALGSGSLASSQWLDDYISQQLNQLNPDSSTSESCDDNFNFSIMEQNYLLPPNSMEAQPGLRRAFDSITDSDEEKCHRKPKRQKREKTLQKNSETTQSPIINSLPYNALDIPQLSSPSAAVSKPRMFACPFSKKLGDKYSTNTKDWKCCLGPGPGWNIHRLKEHLYRKHTAPSYQCPRCLAEFENNSDLREHQRNASSCIVHPDIGSNVEGIDAEQMIKLKKKSRRCSDEEKWNDIYRIIFRLNPGENLPSPYYEDITPVSNCLGVDSLSQFQTYLQSRLQDHHETRQSTSTIQACMELIQSFRKTGDISLPLPEAPSLVFEDDYSTMSYEPDSSTTFSTTTNDYNLNTSYEFKDMSADALAGLDLFDDPFETRFDEVFGLLSHPKPQPNPYQSPRTLCEEL
ncbi:hypothetical protein F4679DRAFT_544665, partial [Xylaria curta]